MYNMYDIPIVSQRTSKIVFKNNLTIPMDVILSSPHCTDGIPWTKAPEDTKLYMCQRRIVYPDQEVDFSQVGDFQGILSQSYQPNPKSAYNFVAVTVPQGFSYAITAREIKRIGELHPAP